MHFIALSLRIFCDFWNFHETSKWSESGVLLDVFLVGTAWFCKPHAITCAESCDRVFSMSRTQHLLSYPRVVYSTCGDRMILQTPCDHVCRKLRSCFFHEQNATSAILSESGVFHLWGPHDSANPMRSRVQKVAIVFFPWAERNICYLIREWCIPLVGTAWFCKPHAITCAESCDRVFSMSRTQHLLSYPRVVYSTCGDRMILQTPCDHVCRKLRSCFFHEQNATSAILSESGVFHLWGPHDSANPMRSRVQKVAIVFFPWAERNICYLIREWCIPLVGTAWFCKPHAITCAESCDRVFSMSRTQHLLSYPRVVYSTCGDRMILQTPCDHVCRKLRSCFFHEQNATSAILSESGVFHLWGPHDSANPMRSRVQKVAIVFFPWAERNICYLIREWCIPLVGTAWFCKPHAITCAESCDRVFSMSRTQHPKGEPFVK